MKLTITNDKKKDFSFVHKVMADISGEGVSVSVPLRYTDVVTLYFKLGAILQEAAQGGEEE